MFGTLKSLLRRCLGFQTPIHQVFGCLGNHHIRTRISQVSTLSPTWCRLPPHRPSQCARYSSPSSHQSFQTMVTNDTIDHVSCQKYVKPLVAGDSSRDPTWSLIVGGHLTIPKQGKKNCHVGPVFEVQRILNHTHRVFFLKPKCPMDFFLLKGWDLDQRVPHYIYFIHECAQDFLDECPLNEPSQKQMELSYHTKSLSRECLNPTQKRTCFKQITSDLMEKKHLQSSHPLNQRHTHTHIQIIQNTHQSIIPGTPSVLFF